MYLYDIWKWASQVALVMPANVGDARDVDLLCVRKIPWISKWQLLQYSCLENTTDKRVWQAAVHWVARLGRDWMTKPPLYLKIGKFILGKTPCHFSQLYLSSRINLCRNALWVEFSPPTTSNLSLKHSLISLFSDTIESLFIPYQRILK